MKRLTPTAILVIGWLGLMLYAYPGFMSFDSILQFLQAQAGVYGGGHPPMMGLLWTITDAVIPGPFGMLVIQSGCFLAGAYLILRRAMSDRAAAICASLLLWFPPVSAVLAVIWKDSQMAGFLMLGTALLLSDRRGVRVGGLLLLFVATAMRYNALAITLPLVVLLFTWSPSHRWWLRYPLAIAIWLGVTLSATFANNLLTPDTGKTYLWHDALALSDLVGTLRYAPDLPDDELRDTLAGTPLLLTTNIQRETRSAFRLEDIPIGKQTFGTGTYVPALWTTVYHVFAEPMTMPQREAIARAWRAIVPSHPTAYLEYRWNVFRELIHLGDDDIPSGAYIWFTDVHDLGGSAEKIGHSAARGRIQDQLRKVWLWLGATWLFRPYLYLVLSLVLAPLCLRDRTLLAVVVSGLANEAALFVLAPTIDYRYSLWLVITTVLVIVMLIAKRASARAPSDRATSQEPPPRRRSA